MEKEIEDLKRALAILHYSQWSREIVSTEEIKWLNDYLGDVNLSTPAPEKDCGICNGCHTGAGCSGKDSVEEGAV